MEHDTELVTVMEEVRSLVSRARATCLWFMREDYTPQNASQAVACLEKIERRGDRDTYIQARRLKEWLLRNSNAKFSR
jgi:hypothetical protein